MACWYRSVLPLWVCMVASCYGDDDIAATVVGNDSALVLTNLTGRSWNYACSPPCAPGSRCDDLQRRCIRHVDCSTSPCLKDGFCSLSRSGYTCSCLAPTCGTNCENICAERPLADACFSVSCPLHQHCRVVEISRNRYRPECVPVSPCDGGCLNGGTCFRSDSGYQCFCTPQYRGRRCQSLSVQSVLIPRPAEGPCMRLNPCRNSCQCVPSCRHASGYYCRSPNGYIGKNCTVPPPFIDCRPNQVVVKVDDSFVREYDMGIGNSRLILGPQSVDALRASQACFPDSNSVPHTFSIPLPFAKCGALVDTSSGQTVVMGTIWLNRITQSDYDMPVPVVNFKCTYGKEYFVVTSLKPAIDQPVQRYGEGLHRVQGTIELCKVPTACPLTCPAVFGVSQGAIYTIGEMIHLNIRPEDTQFRDVVALKSLYLSCDSTIRTSAVVVHLVTGGCIANTMPTRISRSGLDSSVCVSFEVPRLRGCTAFYIHAEMEICGRTGCDLDFRQCGNLPGSRGRRAAEETLIISDVKGPIYAIDGSHGVGSTALFPNTSVVDVPFVINDLADTDASHQSNRWTLLVVGVSLLCVLVLLGAAFLLVLRFRPFTFPGK